MFEISIHSMSRGKKNIRKSCIDAYNVTYLQREEGRQLIQYLERSYFDYSATTVD